MLIHADSLNLILDQLFAVADHLVAKTAQKSQRLSYSSNNTVHTIKMKGILQCLGLCL